MDERLQDCGNGVPALPGGQGTGRQSLHPSDDGIGGEISVATAGEGTIPGVREGPNCEGLFLDPIELVPVLHV